MDRQHAKRVFQQATELPPEERAPFLDRACAGDDQLRADVESLLSSHDGAGAFLGGATAVVPAAPAPGVPVGGEGPGSTIGPYKIVRQIGEGGFGSVYLAEQEHPVRRRVALKIIKAGMDTRQVIARFEAERQALAMMDHPNIARVLDAGATDSGRPYFVMELVQGDPITTCCDAASLTTAARLELFADVCNAVQHAHQKGIIHRDLKPSNVLVAVADGRLIPKVIDFGIAKATAARLTEKSLFTDQRMLIGTPEYMSPEQAHASAADIDTRSDVYSLGVLLYELLTGTTPFEGRRLRSAAFAEIQRIIREEEPPRPSTRLSTMKELAGVAARRDTEPGTLRVNVRGDLDWISMKCLEKDRARRYDSAGALALDIRRHLAGEPVLAAPPSAPYRLRKFVGRHRVGVAAGGLVSGALIVGLGAATWGFVSAGRERDAKAAALVRAVEAEVGEREQRERAESERDMAESVAEFMRNTLRGASPSVARGRDTVMLREMMDAAAARIRSGELKHAPQADLRLRLTIADTYRHLGAYDDALAILEPAEELARSLLPAGGADSTDLAAALHQLGLLLPVLGRPEDGERAARRALDMYRRLAPGDDPSAAKAMGTLALACQHLKRSEEAGALHTESVAMYRRLGPEYAADLSRALGNLAAALQALGRTPEAERLLVESLEIKDRLGAGDGPDVASALNNLGFMRLNLGRAPEAEPLFMRALEIRRRVLPADHPHLVISLANLAHALRVQRRYAEAEPYYVQAAEMCRRLFGDQTLDLADYLNGVALCRRAIDRPADAEAPAREALEIARRNHPGDHLSVASTLTTLAGILRDLKRPAEAEPLFRQSLDIRRRLNPGDHAAVVSGLTALADCLDDLEQRPEADTVRADAAAMKERLSNVQTK